MDVNVLLAKIKAEDCDDKNIDLVEITTEYKAFADKLRPKELQVLSLKVLCMLCRNLEKVPNWKESVDPALLLKLVTTCLYDMKSLTKAEKVQRLACVYHMHRYATKQKVNPKMVFELSNYIFSGNEQDLQPDHAKTYWAILADMLTYVEQLKTSKFDIKTVIGHLSDNIKATILVFNTIHFCNDNLVLVLRKLYYIFSETASIELDKMFYSIFETLAAKNDLELIKKLPDSKLNELYRKMNECFVVIVDNSVKHNFKNISLSIAVRFAISLLGHRSDIFECLQIFYSNFFCNILTDKTQNSNYVNILLKQLLTSIENIAKLNDEKTAVETYPFLNQILRIYLENCVKVYCKNQWTQYFTIETQESYLNFILHLMRKQKNAAQVVKCENCKNKNGYHDSLRASFLLRIFLNTSLNFNMNIEQLLPMIYEGILEQKNILDNLKNCFNIQKCRYKVQTDTHNNAILLYKAKKYEFSCKLFNFYIRNELSAYKGDETQKSCISRAFYNKAICELDMSSHEIALKSAFLSLVFTERSALKSDKYMTLVMDIKAKSLKVRSSDDLEDELDPLQSLTVVHVCRDIIDNNQYGDLKIILKSVVFSELLRHEMALYARLWPSVQPVTGVWCAFEDLLARKDNHWMYVEPEESLLWHLCCVFMETACCVRNINNEHFSRIVRALTDRFNKSPPKLIQFKVVYASLLFLMAEFDINEAKIKFGWKEMNIDQLTKDLDSICVSETLAQEYEALNRAIQGVEYWTLILPEITAVPKVLEDVLPLALRVSEWVSPLLLQYSRNAHALQLAHVTAQLAWKLQDIPSYMKSIGLLVSESKMQCDQLDSYIKTASKHIEKLLKDESMKNIALTYLCEAAMYHNRCGDKILAAKIINYVQKYILEAITDDENALDTACGRLLEAQVEICETTPGTPCTMTAVNAVQRHYLTAKGTPCMVTGTSWASRRYRGCLLSLRASTSSLKIISQAVKEQFWRRARAAGPALCRAGRASAQAHAHCLLAYTHNIQVAQVKVDTVKSILDLPLNEITVSKPLQTENKPTKTNQLKPDALETVLDTKTFKLNRPNTSPYSFVPGFRIPDFLTHVKTCQCHACQNPVYSILTLQVFGIEASIHFRNQEFEISDNYFKGVIDMSKFVKAKIRYFLEDLLTKKLEKYVVKIAKEQLAVDLAAVEINILIEAAFFELAQLKTDVAEKHAADIFEKLGKYSQDAYLKNEVLNLACAIEKIKSNTKKSVKKSELGIESDFEKLHLSPSRNAVEITVTTPENKTSLPPKREKSKVVLKDEELPQAKRKIVPILKFENLDVSDENSKSDQSNSSIKTRKAKKDFKVPELKTAKPIPEIITPMKSTKKILVKDDKTTRAGKTVKTSEIVADKSNKQDVKENIPKSIQKTSKIVKENIENEPKTSDEMFFTPLSKKTEEFFTPMTSMKTYSKNSLRHQVIKNLESEFHTPKPLKQECDTFYTPIGEKQFDAKKCLIGEKSANINDAKKIIQDNKLDRCDAKNNKLNTNAKMPDDSDDRQHAEPIKTEKLDALESILDEKNNELDVTQYLVGGSDDKECLLDVKTSIINNSKVLAAKTDSESDGDVKNKTRKKPLTRNVKKVLKNSDTDSEYENNLQKEISNEKDIKRPNANKLDNKRNFKRATSPGKLNIEKVPKTKTRDKFNLPTDINTKTETVYKTKTKLNEDSMPDSVKDDLRQNLKTRSSKRPSKINLSP